MLISVSSFSYATFLPGYGTPVAAVPFLDELWYLELLEEFTVIPRWRLRQFVPVEI